MRLGRSDVTVSRIGLGTAPLAGLYTPVGEEQAAATLEAAWSAGVRYFDTAPRYGAGLAELRLGRFLKGVDRSRVTVSSKVGALLDPVRRDYTVEGVYASLAASLERTGLDAFDILLIHDPDDHWEQAVRHAYPALERLRAQGGVRAVGVGMNQTSMLARFVRETDVDCVMVAGRYSLLDRSAERELLPLCGERGTGVIVAGVFNGGILADPGPGAHYDYAPAAEPVLSRARGLAARCAAYDVPLAAAALQFPLRHPAVTGVVVGARSPEEVGEDLSLAAVPIPDSLWAELDPE
ncbi:aldo/keto reductase [Nonomuraea zeae]|uniref:Aldo/keto reductase n=1 Tax=Nonomuraea zeae TaxID=1642303 RepID=A0A5S4GMC0_9ACTN|nr:aldo/keto reductase [Nonomuraea zeae]TMR33721.1 aldo/keto reductase [Nonomuraea zeae]